MPEGLRRLLAHRAAPAAILLLSLLLTLPALGGGWSADDWVHRLVLHGAPGFPERQPLLDLFTFLEPGPWNQALQERGLLPWGASPDLRIRFLRPLSAATHWLDIRLWPDSAPLQHAHSLLWWLLCLVAVRAVTRDCGPAWVAGLALLLFALDDAHAAPIAWLANRNVLICLALSLSALALQQRGRAGWALLPLGAALLASEAAIGAVAYLAAWELTRGRSWVQRLLRMGPALGLVVLWRVAYSLGGYGAKGSGLYVDPVRSPLDFIAAALERGPLLVVGQWLGAPIEAWMFASPSSRWALAGISWLACGALLAGLWPLLRASRPARFWALGSLGATLPLCAAFPMDRLLLFPGLGASVLLALWVAHGSRGAKGMLACALLGAGVLPLKVWGFNPLMRAATEAQVPASPQAPRRWVFVQGSVFGSFYPMLAPMAQGQAPEQISLLAPAWTSVVVRRPAPHVLELQAEEGWLLRPVDQIALRPDALGPGPHPSAGFEVEVLAWTPDHRPLRVQARFEDIHAHRFLIWQDGAVQDWTLPPVDGQATVDPSVPLAW